MQQTKYMRIVAAGLLITLFAACAKDDTIVPYDTTEGIPCTVTLNVGAAPAPEITVTRADNSLSALSSLKIFVYDKDGQVCQNVATLSSTDITENDTYRNGNGETLYKVSIETTSGEKQLFAIANYGSGYWDQSGIEKLCSQAEQGALTLAELRDGVVSLSNDDFNINTDGNLNLPSITASNQMLISGWNTGVVFAAGNAGTGTVTIYGTRGDSNGSVAIKMQRSMAHISFNISSDSYTKYNNGVKHTCRFTPSTFRVYNIPMKILIGQTDETRTMADANKVQEYLISASTNVGTNQSGDYAFDFYMPENVQKPGTSQDYADRDAWNYGDDQASTTGDGALPEEKTWTNAPQNSTFVVIKGTYEETTGENEDPYYTANVNYTVHLGDFSGDTNYDNFSVVRNYKYTYNMEVQGVDKIVVEAKKTGGETQSGAEGDVYDASQCVYNYQLDAHYEQVFLQYNLSSMARSLASGLSGEDLDNAIADKLILVIQSEAMDYTGGIGNVANKRGSIKPYKIYADAVRGKSGDEAETAAANAKSDALNDDPANHGQSTPKKGFDYKWVEFWPQSGTQLAAYPGVSAWSREDLTGFSNGGAYGGNPTTNSGYLKDVYDVIVAMGNVVKKIYKGEGVSTDDRGEDGITITKSNNDYVARFTAFVNEYYYYRHPLTGLKVTTWSVMTNKIPREMIIAMSTDVSNDGNSSYSQLHSYISQLSMQTFYSSRSMSLNAFGIESYNETPISYSFDGNTLPESLNDPRESDALTQTDGRYNQIRLLQRTPSQNGTYGSWETYINSGQNGYFSTTTADRASHKLNNAYNIKYAYSACLSRNRDLNGNGTIDDNEVRWYLASVNEYIRMGIGTNALSNLARLYMGAKGDMVKSQYPASYTTDGALYYTSSRDTYNGWGYSSSGQRLYWAVERGAYGGDQYSNIPMRCIRILPAHTDDQDITSVYNVKSDPTYEWDATNRILKFKGRLVDELYRQYVSDVLMPHNEDSNANSFYDGIYVAEEDVYEIQQDHWWENPTKVTKKFPLAQIINYDGNQENPCADYHETGDGGAVWRVPNLAELSALVAQGLINQDVEDACCTQFSNMNVRFGFAFSSLVYCPGGGENDTTVDKFGTTFAVRCVRDVPPGSTLLE